MSYGDTARVIPAERSAVVVELHAAETEDSNYVGLITTVPILYWVERLTWTKVSDAMGAERYPQVRMFPVTPGDDGLPQSYHQCENVVGWVVVHGMLTEAELRNQLKHLAFSSMVDVMHFGYAQGCQYELMEGVADHDPSSALNRHGIWVGAGEAVPIAVELNKATAVISKLWEQAPDTDLEQIALSDELRQLVIN